MYVFVLFQIYISFYTKNIEKYGLASHSGITFFHFNSRDDKDAVIIDKLHISFSLLCLVCPFWVYLKTIPTKGLFKEKLHQNEIHTTLRLMDLIPLSKNDLRSCILMGGSPSQSFRAIWCAIHDLASNKVNMADKVS